MLIVSRPETSPRFTVYLTKPSPLWVRRGKIRHFYHLKSTFRNKCDTMNDLNSAAPWTNGLVEIADISDVKNELRPVTGIATGVVLGICCWAIIGWIVHSLWI